MSEKVYDEKGKGKEQAVGRLEDVGGGLDELPRWTFPGFSLSSPQHRDIPSPSLLPGKTLRFYVTFDRPETVARFEAELVGRCTVSGSQSCTFLSTTPHVFLPPLREPSRLYWDLTIPYVTTCSCEPDNPLPLPGFSNGWATAGGCGKDWTVDYALECTLSELGQRKMGFGKREVKKGETQQFVIPMYYHIPFSPARARPLLEEVPPRLASLPLPKDVKSPDKLDCSTRGAEVLTKRTLLWDLESADVGDLRVKHIELRYEITTPPFSLLSLLSCSSPPATLKFRLSTSFGTRRYPSVQPFIQRLSSLPSTATLKVDRVTTTKWKDGAGHEGKEQVREGMLLVLHSAEGKGRGKGKEKEGTNLYEAVREVRLEEGEVVCEMRMVNGNSGKDVRAEDVSLVFEGEVGVFGRRDGDALSRVRTCMIEVRYDLTATFSLTPASSSTSPPVSHSMTASDIRLDLPADLASPAYDPSAAAAASPAYDPSVAAGPSSGVVRVDEQKTPALAALYGGTSSRAGQTVRAEQAQEEGLPAYEVGGSALTSADEKRPEGPSDVPSSTLAPLPPPLYTAASTSTAATAPPPAFSPSSSSSAADPILDSDHPPTWEETVREDMVDDWVAASAVYGEEGGGGREGGKEEGEKEEEEEQGRRR